MALLCAGNGLLWWGWGPATGHAWAVNADFFIALALPVYSFMTLPLFTALFLLFWQDLFCARRLFAKYHSVRSAMFIAQQAFNLLRSSKLRDITVANRKLP